VPQITLYTYWRSSCSYRVRIALAYKGLAYESIPVNLLKGEQQGEDNRARSAFATVPTIVIDGKASVESVAILELIDELFPMPALYPREPWARARVRALVETVNAGTQPLQNLSVLHHLSTDKAARDAWSKHFIARGLAAFERLMAQYETLGVSGPFAFGEAVTAADVLLVPQVYNARRVGVDLAPLRRVVAASNAATAHPAFVHAAPENQADAVRDA
jgi:maleylpyruvate isomerase